MKFLRRREPAPEPTLLEQIDALLAEGGDALRMAKEAEAEAHETVEWIQSDIDNLLEARAELVKEGQPS